MISTVTQLSREKSRVGGRIHGVAGDGSRICDRIHGLVRGGRQGQGSHWSRSQEGHHLRSWQRRFEDFGVRREPHRVRQGLHGCGVQRLLHYELPGTNLPRAVEGGHWNWEGPDDHYPFLHRHSEDRGWCVGKGLAWRSCGCVQYYSQRDWCGQGRRWGLANHQGQVETWMGWNMFSPKAPVKGFFERAAANLHRQHTCIHHHHHHTMKSTSTFNISTCQQQHQRRRRPHHKQQQQHQQQQQKQQQQRQQQQQQQQQRQQQTQQLLCSGVPMQLL